MCFHNKKNQSLFKTFTFGVMHVSVAFLVTYLITGSMVLGGIIALVEPAVNTVFFYFHERIWNHFDNKKRVSSSESLEFEK